MRNAKRKLCMKKATKKRISMEIRDTWDSKGGLTRKGERAYRKEGAD